MSVSRADILAAIKAATGDPSTGVVCDALPGIADAVDALLNPPATDAAKRSTRVVEAPETR